MNYVDGDPANSSETTKARKPLAAAEVVVEEVEGNPGYYTLEVLPAAALPARRPDGVAAPGLEAAVGEGGVTAKRPGDPSHDRAGRRACPVPAGPRPGPATGRGQRHAAVAGP